MQCLNCHDEVEGHFCGNCGQKATAARYTLGGIVKQAFYSVTEFDNKGIIPAIRELSLRPGGAIREYLGGRRMKLYPPVKYLFFVGAIGTFLVLRYHFMSLTAEENQQNGIYQLLIRVFPYISRDFLNMFFLYAEEFTTVVNVLTIPVFSFFSYLYFRKFGYNFAESLILNTYITAHQLLLLLLFVIPNELYPQYRSGFIDLYGIITMAYNIWVYVDFYKAPLAEGLYRSVFAVIISYLLQFVVNIGIFYFVVRNLPSTGFN